MYEDMFEISKKFKENNITAIFMKGMALNLAEIQQTDQRHCRDIDILVDKIFLNKAYEILKLNGFSYLDKECEDKTTFLSPMHHLPPLSNGKGTVVELHHRVTSPHAFRNCPLKQSFLENYQTIKGINIPAVSDLILHELYHGVVHNSLGDGLICLIDLKKILKKFSTQINIEKTQKTLKIDRENLLKIRKIISLSTKEDTKYNEVEEHINSLFKNRPLFCQNRKEQLRKNFRIHKRIILWFEIVKFQYQISFFSIKYLRLSFRKFFNLVKRSYL